MEKIEALVGIITNDKDLAAIAGSIMEMNGFRPQVESLVGILEHPEKYRRLLDLNPDVLIFDIPPPYEANWSAINRLLKREDISSRGLVFMSTYTSLEKLIEKSPSVQLINLPFDIDDFTHAVKRSYQEAKNPPA